MTADACFVAHGVSCRDTEPEWCRCCRHLGHPGEHRCACGHRWGTQPHPGGREAGERFDGGLCRRVWDLLVGAVVFVVLYVVVVIAQLVTGNL